MNKYERFFGAGPRGASISLVLLALAYMLEDSIGLPAITHNDALKHLGFLLATLITLAILIWSLISLPPRERGRQLVTTGAYKYFRHPLYAAFLSGFNLGLALLLNNWIYIGWAILLHPIWHLNVVSEEKMLRRQFGQDYDDYCKTTGRFFPRLLHAPVDAG